MRKTLRKMVAAVLMVCLCSIYFQGAAAARAEANSSNPGIVISEIVAKSSGSGQLYEYVEIYNMSDASIDLSGYHLLYYTSNFDSAANRWPIGKTIAPNSTLVLWLQKYNVSPKPTLAMFNQNYGVSLSASQVVEVSLTTAAQGLHDTSKRRVGIENAAGSLVAAAYFNDAGVDGITDRSVIYGPPASGVDAVRIANDQEATPGSIVPGQFDGTSPIPSALPKLLITELVQDTDNYAGFDAFEYVELYNTTALPISLENYKLSLLSGSNALKWEQAIGAGAVIEPYSTFVIWTHVAEIDPIIVEGFNSYYYDSYQLKWLGGSELYRMGGVGGLVNTSKHIVTLADPQGGEVVRASYNDTVKDVALGTSTSYSYPVDGSKLMRKTGVAQTPTPGWVHAGQVPAKPKQDAIPPAMPQGLQAIAGDGFVQLNWLPNTESDLDSYRIYKDGALEWSVPAAQQEAVISQLWGNISVSLAVTAVDTSGNESQQSVISATPGHQILTQQTVGSSVPGAVFDQFWQVSEEGALIPGLHQDIVPQGIAYDADNDWFIMSAYMRDKRPSSLSVIDASNGQLIKSVLLNNDDGTPYVGHAGGVTVSKHNIWVSSGEYLHRLPKDALEQAADNDELAFSDKFLTPTRGSSATYHNGVLWAGEFYASSSPTDPSHAMVNRDGNTYNAWLAGYELDPITDLPVNSAVPSYILSIADSVQGATFTDDYVITSQSYNRYADSHLTRYNNPLATAPHTTVMYNGVSVPVWFLDNQERAPGNSLLHLPAMSEGVIAVGDDVYVLFESGATRYRYTTTFVSDHIRKVSLPLWEGLQ